MNAEGSRTWWKYAGALVALAVLAGGGLMLTRTLTERRKQAEAARQAEEQRRLKAERKQRLAQNRLRAAGLVGEAAEAVSRASSGDGLRALLVKLAQTQVMVGDEGSAMATARRVPDAQARVRTLADVALLASVTAGREAGMARVSFQPAIEAATALSLEIDRVRALVYIAGQQSQCGIDGEATVLPEAIRRTSAMQDGGLFQSLGWKHVAMVQAATGDLRGALANASKIPVRPIRVADFLDPVVAGRSEVLVAVALGYRRSGDTAKAREVLQEALSVARQEEDADRWEHLHEVADAQVEVGDLPGARQTLREALSTARNLRKRLPDEQYQGTLAMVAIGLPKAGDLPGALELVKELSNKRWAAAALAQIAAAVKARKPPDEAACESAFHQALAIVREIPKDDDRNAVLVVIAQNEASAGRVAEALKTARSIADGESRTQALLGTGKAQIEAGDLVGARATLREAASIVAAKKGQRILSGLAEGQARAGDISGAMATARRIADMSARADALLATAQALSKCSESSCSGATP